MIRFFVPGDPKTKGSAKVVTTRSGRPIVTNDCKREKPWAAMVQAVAWEQRPPQPWDGSVVLSLSFVMPRPARLGKKQLGVPCDRKPDWDKLSRSVCDALSRVLWTDDARVVLATVSKRYANPGEVPGVWVEAGELVAG